MSNIHVVTLAVLTAMLIGAASLATTDSAFAGGYKSKSQSTAQVNECGNGGMPMNILCQNVGSQAQGEENAVVLEPSQQGGN